MAKKNYGLDDETVEKVKAMLNAGYYTGEIARELDIPEAIVIRIRGERK